MAQLRRRTARSGLVRILRVPTADRGRVGAPGQVVCPVRSAAVIHASLAFLAFAAVPSQTVTPTIKPLRECISAFRDRVTTDYDAKSVESLEQIITACGFKLFGESEDSSRVDGFRAVLWYANGALTRKGLAPAARRSLGAIPRRATRLLHEVRLKDAAYYDLQWLALKCPHLIPEKWAGIRGLLGTAPGGRSRREGEMPPGEMDITFGEADRDTLLSQAFAGADRLIARKMSIARKCC